MPTISGNKLTTPNCIASVPFPINVDLFLDQINADNNFIFNERNQSLLLAFLLTLQDVSRTFLAAQLTFTVLVLGWCEGLVHGRNRQAPAVRMGVLALLWLALAGELAFAAEVVEVAYELSPSEPPHDASTSTSTSAAMGAQPASRWSVRAIRGRAAFMLANIQQVETS